MNDQQLLRYNSHILLKDIDAAGQQALLDSHVAVIGCGGLGSPIALYLAASGIGTLSLVDFDQVELTNLQRQIAHNTATIGVNKAESCRQHCLAINPDIKINAIDKKLDLNQMTELANSCQVVVDATDNFESRFMINRASVKSKTPLVSGAAIGFDAQLSVYNPVEKDSPCYHCLYREQGDEDQLCSNSGVVSPLVGVIGSLQALEVIKLITGVGQTLKGKLQIFDAKSHQWRTINLKKDPHCEVCSG